MAFDYNDFLTTRALALAEDAWPGTFSYGDKDYPCAIGEQPYFQQQKHDAHGLQATSRISITIRRNLIPDDVEFLAGQFVTLKNLRSGETFPLMICSGADMLGRDENTDFDGNKQLTLVARTQV